MHPAVIQQVKISPADVAAGMPHRRDLLVELQIDQKAESELGRMCLRGQISDLQYDAGHRYAGIVGAYRATIEMPNGLAGRGRGFDCMGMCGPKVANELDPCICRIRKESYDAAYEVLFAAGQKAAKAVSQVAIYDRLCPLAWRQDLLIGLSALVTHMGLTTVRRLGRKN